MDLGMQRFEAFMEVAATGSFTAAAAKLGYTQSGVSRMIASLESNLGLVLFERVRGEVSLTPEGRELMPHVAALCDDARRLEEEVHEVLGLETGIVHIGTFTSVATYWLPSIIADLQRDYPGIECDLRLGDYAEIERWVAEGTVDCGFVRLPAAAGLEAQVLADDEFVAVLPEGHELSELAAVPAAKLAELPFMELANGKVSDVEFIFEDRGIRLNPRVSTWDDYAIMAMVESGLGVAVLPSLVLKRSPFRLKILPLDPPAFRTIAVATRVGGHLSPAARKFMEYLRLRRG